MHVNKGRLLYLKCLQLKWIVRLNSWTYLVPLKGNFFLFVFFFYFVFRSQ